MRGALAHRPPPSWVLRGGTTGGEVAALDYDFEHNRYWQAHPVYCRDPSSLLVVSRASAGYVDDLAGNWVSVPANQLRVSNKGALSEEARTNSVLWNRDLTNAAWVKSNTTTALDQIGVDGTAGAASSLTATAGNGTILQAITLVSEGYFLSAFVKRVAGSGVVNMTMDGGATWTAIPITSGWSKISIPAQTLANPIVGFEIVTSGDKIAVDFVQLELGAFATSPISTTNASVTRAVDFVKVVNPPLFSRMSICILVKAFPNTVISNPANQVPLTISDGTLNNRVSVLRNNTNGTVVATDTYAGVGTNWGAFANPAFFVWGQGQKIKLVSNYDNSNGSNTSQTGTVDGGAIYSLVSDFPLGLDTVNVGSNPTGGAVFNGYVQRFAILLVRQPDVFAQFITGANGP